MYSNNQQVIYWKGEMFVALKRFLRVNQWGFFMYVFFYVNNNPVH